VRRSARVPSGPPDGGDNYFLLRKTQDIEPFLKYAAPGVLLVSVSYLACSSQGRNISLWNTAHLFSENDQIGVATYFLFKYI
jgi:hypothetical protein